MLFDVVCACFKIEYFINTRAYDLHKKIFVSSSILCATTSTKYSRNDFQQNVKKKILSRENEKYLVSKFTSLPIDTKSKQKLIHNANVSSVIITPIS